MAAIPAAPAAKQSAAFASVIPPMASTGIGDRAAHFGEPLQTLRRAERRFRRRGEDGAKEKIVRAAVCCCPRGFERMAGNADEEIFLFAALFDNSLGFRQRQTLFAKMHAAGEFRQRDIQPVVNDDARCR